MSKEGETFLAHDNQKINTNTIELLIRVHPRENRKGKAKTAVATPTMIIHYSPKIYEKVEEKGRFCYLQPIPNGKFQLIPQ